AWSEIQALLQAQTDVLPRSSSRHQAPALAVLPAVVTDQAQGACTRTRHARSESALLLAVQKLFATVHDAALFQKSCVAVPGGRVVHINAQPPHCSAPHYSVPTGAAATFAVADMRARPEHRAARVVGYRARSACVPAGVAPATRVWRSTIYRCVPKGRSFLLQVLAGFQVWLRQKRIDHHTVILLARGLVNESTEGQIKQTKSKRAKDRDCLLISAWWCCRPQQIGECAANKVTVPHELLCHMHRCLRAANVLDIVDDVIAGENQLG